MYTRRTLHFEGMVDSCNSGRVRNRSGAIYAWGSRRVFSGARADDL